jgi:hypothetical protein
VERYEVVNICSNLTDGRRNLLFAVSEKRIENPVQKARLLRLVKVVIPLLANLKERRG